MTKPFDFDDALTRVAAEAVANGLSVDQIDVALLDAAILRIRLHQSDERLQDLLEDLQQGSEEF